MSQWDTKRPVCQLTVSCLLVRVHWTATQGTPCSRHLTHLPLDKMAAIVADMNFKWISLNENERIPIQISLKFVPRSLINNKPALVQVMAWRLIGDKPLSEVNQCLPDSLTHICGTRGRWVNSLNPGRFEWNFRLIFKLILVIHHV